MSIFNPTKPYKLSSEIIKVENQLKVNFVFTGFKNTNIINGLFNSLSTINKSFCYNLLFSKDNFSTSLARVSNKQKAVSNQVNISDTLGTDLLDNVAKKLHSFIMSLNPLMHQELQEELKQMEDIQENLQETKVGLTNIQLIFTVDVDSFDDAKKVTDIVYNLAVEHQVILSSGYGIQDVLYRASILSTLPDKNYSFGLSDSLMPLFNPLINETYKIAKDSLFLGKTTFNSPLWIDYAINVENANHCLVLGSTGMGKSALTKSVIAQHSKLGHRILILDPQNEYETLTNYLGGDHVDLTKDYGLNIFDLDKYDSLQDLTKTVKMLCEAVTASNIDDSDTKIINGCLHAAKISKSKDKFKTFLSSLKKTKLEYLVLPLENEKIVKLFTSNKNNKQLDNKVIRFNFSDLNENELILFVSVVSQVISQIMSDKSEPTLLVIDEAFKFLSANSSTQVESWLRQMRKNNTALLLIDQGIRAYTIADTIWENTQHHILFRHNATEAIRIDKVIYEEVEVLPRRQFLYHNNKRMIFGESIIPNNILPYV